MKNIREKLQEMSVDFDKELHAVRSERRLKKNDPKTFDELWSRYEDLGQIGQLWSSMNRSEHLVNYCLQLFFRNLGVEVEASGKEAECLEEIRNNKLFAERVLLFHKTALFIKGFEAYFTKECEHTAEMKDFHQLRNLLAHCEIMFSNSHREYYLQDRKYQKVVGIPLGIYKEQVKKNLRTLFPWLVEVTNKLATKVMLGKEDV